MRLLLLATALVLTSGLLYAGFRSWQQQKRIDNMLLPDVWRAIVGVV